MKPTKTKAGRNGAPLQSIQNYTPYFLLYAEPDILDTDEAKVMKCSLTIRKNTIDILDSDEDIVMQYYKGGFFNHEPKKSLRRRIHA